MITEAHREHLREIGQRGGLARAKQFTTASQQAARACVSTESNAANGRKGFAAWVERSGPHAPARRLAAWRATRPTALIRIVAGWLDEMWITCSTEVELLPGKIYADIIPHVWPRRIVIECDGQHWHEPNDHVGEDRVARDRERDAQIIALGYELLHLAEADIESGAAREQLVLFLATE